MNRQWNQCRSVLDHFDASTCGASLPPRFTPLGGGFSGAGVVRVDWGDRSAVLRQWPSDGPPRARLRELHVWLRALGDAGIPIAVPRPDRSGATLVEFQGSWWQLENWLPGTAETSRDISAARLRSAMRSLSRLHEVSSRYVASAGGREWFRSGRGPSPAVETRLRLLRDWAGPVGADVRRDLAGCGPTPLLPIAWDVLDLLGAVGDSVARHLQECRNQEVELFPCLCDVWSAHVLYTGDEVSGLIDPAAARVESAAADLARLGASYGLVDPDRWQAAFRAYGEIRPLVAGERQLVEPLARSGLLLSALTWVRRLARGEVSGDEARVCERVARLVQTLRAMPTGGLWLRS